MYRVRVHEVGGHVIVTVVDEELLGKKFEENGIILDVDESFFGGGIVDENVALREMFRATSLYVIGERSVELAIKASLIHPQAVKRVQGVPYAQMLLLQM